MGGMGYNVNALLQSRWAISPGHTNSWLYPYRPVAVPAPGAFGGGVAPVAGIGAGIYHNPYINKPVLTGGAGLDAGAPAASTWARAPPRTDAWLGVPEPAEVGGGLAALPFQKQRHRLT